MSTTRYYNFLVNLINYCPRLSVNLVSYIKGKEQIESVR